MTLTAIQTNELGKMMREHITCILRMEAVQMKLDWTEVFSSEQILSCCDKMPAGLGSGEDLPSNVQRELIQNPQFMSWLAGLLTLIQEETADKEEVERQAHAFFRSLSPLWKSNRPQYRHDLPASLGTKRSMAQSHGKIQSALHRNNGNCPAVRGPAFPGLSCSPGISAALHCHGI